MKKRKKKYKVKRRYEYQVDDVVFRFIPGSEWGSTSTYPGNPEKREIHHQVLTILKEKDIFQEGK